MTQLLVDAITMFNWFVLAYFVLLNGTYLFIIGGAVTAMMRSIRRADPAGRDDIFANPLTPPVSVLVPAFNEAAGIVESVRAMIALRYPLFEVIVVDDGSTDETFELLRLEFDLHEVPAAFDADVPTRGSVRSMHIPAGREPLVVIRKTNSGRRADALNVAINAARYPLVCMVDADSLLEPDALLRVAQPFVDDPARVVATGGVIRAVNGARVYRGQIVDSHQPDRWIERIQIIEYLRSFLVGRTGWSRVSGLLIISGAFGLFRRDLIVEIGGLDLDSLGEDADLVATLHRHLRDGHRDYSIAFVPEPVCWTELPRDRVVLGRQRRRWSHGLCQVLWKQRRMMLNPRYGRVGLVVLPYYLCFELLGPVVELTGLASVGAGFALGIVDARFVLLFATVAFAYGILLSMAALAVDEFTHHRPTHWRDLGIGAVAAVVENIGFRQLHAVWRLQGIIASCRRRPAVWGAMPRTGFTMEDPRGASAHRTADRPPHRQAPRGLEPPLPARPDGIA